MANLIQVLQDVRLRGTDQQVGDELLARGARMSLPAPQPATGNTGLNQYIVYGGQAITNYALHNRSGGAATIGLGFRFRNDQWKAG